MKKLFFLLLISFSLSLPAQTVHRTQLFHSNVKTLQINVQGETMGLPIIELNGSSVLQLSFDEMSHGAHSYSYKVMHCNADWTLSSLNSNEYIAGFTTGTITDYMQSLNTTFLYTHYKLNLPNDDMNFKLSGNYVVEIYEDNQTDKPIACACFSVVEPRINITANLRGNTDTEVNGRLQQLDVEVNLNGYQVRDAATELKMIVRQNNRIDNQVTDLKPTYLSGSKLSYINNKMLIFDGGYEYHRFDISSVYAAGVGVEGVRFQQGFYHAKLYDDKIQTSRLYMQEMDVNGKFVVNMQRANNNDTEADYMYVHVNLPVKQPFFDGQVYLGGEFNYNQLNDVSRLKYDVDAGAYSQTLLLKQGGYNYQYWFVPKGTTKASPERIDGNHWETKNQYTIYVYHRGWGERYDRLVGVKNME
jgi:hypothetical protein